MNETQEQIKEENPIEENVIVDIDESEQKKLDKIETYRKPAKEYEDFTDSKPRKQYGKKSQLNFLRDLDGEKKDNE